MRLIHFRVRDFRSFSDSGWVEAGAVTTVYGSNGAGKSNLLSALWKLNPLTKAGAVKLERDIPKGGYTSGQPEDEAPVFIEGVFETDGETRGIVREVLPLADDKSRVYVSRALDGELKIALDGRYDPEQVCALTPALSPLIPRMVLFENFGSLEESSYLPSILSRYSRFGYNVVSRSASPSMRLILSFLGISSTKLLGEARQAKKDKSLRVLMPPDISETLANNRAFYDPLIQSGCARLSDLFSSYWEEPVRIRMEFSAETLRIFIKREERAETDLFQCEAGLQWFLSVLLLFAVETRNNYKNAILLLDESGMAIAQGRRKNLFNLLENVSKSGQIMLATADPTMVPRDRLSDVRLVYHSGGHSHVNNQLTHLKLLQSIWDTAGLKPFDLSACVPVVVSSAAGVCILEAVKGYLTAGGWLDKPVEIVFFSCGRQADQKSVAEMFVTLGKKPFLLNELGAFDPLTLVSARWVAASSKDYLFSENLPLPKRGCLADYCSAHHLSDLQTEQIAKRIKLYAAEKYPRLCSVCRRLFRKWLKLFRLIEKSS